LGDTESDRDSAVFFTKERNWIQIRVFKELFDAVGGITEWDQAHHEENMRNKKILSDLLGTPEQSGTLHRDNPELFERLFALRGRISSNEQSREVSAVIIDLVDELEKHSDFSMPSLKQEE